MSSQAEQYRRRGIEAWQRAAQATDRGVAAALSGILIFRRAIPLHLPCVFLHNRLGDRSMPAPELQIGNRTAYLRKAITSPDFSSERVLARRDARQGGGISTPRTRVPDNGALGLDRGGAGCLA
jgi:hypothetical protein